MQQVRADEIVTVIVPAAAPWTDTGIDVRNGDSLAIRTWGRVRYDPAEAATATPRGSAETAGGCSFVVVAPNVAAHSLVANIAPALTFDGRGFQVGTGWKGTVPVSGSSASEGRLLLGFNDRGVLCDRSGYDSWQFAGTNSGWFTAEVAITRGRQRPDAVR